MGGYVGVGEEDTATFSKLSELQKEYLNYIKDCKEYKKEKIWRNVMAGCAVLGLALVSYEQINNWKFWFDSAYTVCCSACASHSFSKMKMLKEGARGLEKNLEE